jgi:HK97 family phage prohead protease
MATVEYRLLAKPSVGVKATTRVFERPDGGIIFSGYVFAWDTPSEDIGGFRELFRRGSCAKAISQPENIFCVLDHEEKVLNNLGDRDSQTLHLFEDDHGLGFMVQSDDTTAARDAFKIVRRGKTGVSLAMVVLRDRKTTTAGGRLREILELQAIKEISLVMDAAYKSSEVSAVEASTAASRSRPAGRDVEILRRELELHEAEWWTPPAAILEPPTPARRPAAVTYPRRYGATVGELERELNALVSRF